MTDIFRLVTKESYSKWMKISSYNPEKVRSGENVFYIQNKGYNAGKPLKKPIPNCWEVITETPNAYEICFLLFSSKLLEIHIIGSVIPFLRLSDYKKIALPFLTNPAQLDEDVSKKIKTLRDIDHALKVEDEKIKLLKNLKITIAQNIIEIFKKQTP